jgi:Mn-dependent DtxR family transcriptional regulator
MTSGSTGIKDMTDFKGYGANYQHYVKKRIADAIAGADTLEVAADYVMEILNDLRLVSYSKRDRVSLLTQAGRAFVLLIENPNSTQREIAVRLGINDSGAQRLITKLLEDGLVQRQKRGQGYSYRPHYESVWKHPDVWRFALAIADMSKKQPEDPH